jgi:hypothetical protein
MPLRGQFQRWQLDNSIAPHAQFDNPCPNMASAFHPTIVFRPEQHALAASSQATAHFLTV